MIRPIHIRVLLALVAVAALGLVTGCGGGDGGGYSGGSGNSDDPASDMVPVSLDDLEGKTLNSTLVKGQELVPGTKVTFSFGPGVMTASAGCNTLRGEYEVNEGAFSLSKAAGTLLGCPKELQAQDEWLTSVLTVGLRPYERDGTFVFLGLGVEIEMEEGSKPGATPPVVGTAWLLNSYTDTKGNAVSMNPGVQLPSLEFKKDGTVQAFDGCNSGSGKAEVREDGFIDFGPIALTRKACPGITAEVSKAILDVIGGKAAYGFEGASKNLVISKSGSSLTYVLE